MGSSFGKKIEKEIKKIREISRRPISLGYALVGAAAIAFGVDYVRH